MAIGGQGQEQVQALVLMGHDRQVAVAEQPVVDPGEGFFDLSHPLGLRK